MHFPTIHSSITIKFHVTKIKYDDKMLVFTATTLQTSARSYPYYMASLPEESNLKLKMSRCVSHRIEDPGILTGMVTPCIGTAFWTTLLNERDKGRGRERRQKQLQDDVMEKRRYWNLREGALSEEIVFEKPMDLSQDRLSNQYMLLLYKWKKTCRLEDNSRLLVKINSFSLHKQWRWCHFDAIVMLRNIPCTAEH